MLTGLREAARIVLRSRRVKNGGFKKYSGKPEKICRTIIERAFRKHGFFPVSLGHFSEFYVRDFSWCAAALVELGYKKEVDKTIDYAMRRFLRAGRIGTMITPSGKVYDFPGYGPDALALFLHTLEVTKTDSLVKKHKAFFQSEINRFVKEVLDPSRPLPKEKTYFTNMRDHAKRNASCYDAIMIAIVARVAEKHGLKFPASYNQVKDEIKKEYWNGTYFFNDLNKQDIVVADGNVFAFWTGVFTDRDMLVNVITAIQAAGLDSPFPLRYVSSLDKRYEKVSWHVASFFTPDYETDTLWTHQGLAYIRLLSHIDPTKAKEHLQQYTANLKKYKTFLELYDRQGKPYATFFYVSDEGMVWCAPYLALAKKLKVV